MRLIRPPKLPVLLKLHFVPGECAQIDWGVFGMVKIGNTRRRLSFFVIVLAYSPSCLFRFSVSFPDANALLAECARRGLEGIVSKRKDAPYRSGTRSGCTKVKAQAWKDANRYRPKLFEKG